MAALILKTPIGASLHNELGFSQKSKHPNSAKSNSSDVQNPFKLPELKKQTEPVALQGKQRQAASHQGESDERDLESGAENPFHMPSDFEVFQARDQDRAAKEVAKNVAKKMPIWERGVKRRKNFKTLLAEDEDDSDFYEKLRKRDADKILVNGHSKAADRHFGKENLHDYIAKKREMFLVQYALGVKREEMRKLEEIAQAEEQKLLDDEKALEEDAAKFDAFLKENDKNSVEAIKKAEMETKAKLEKIQEIKKLNVLTMSVRSDMSKNEDQLRDLQRYRHFLDKLTPKEWFDEKKKKTTTDKKGVDEDINGTDSKKDAKNRSAGAAAETTAKTGKPKATVQSDDSGKNDDEGVQDEDDEFIYDEDDNVELFFKSSQQLMDIFAELEENNLALIQNCQETEETLEELKQKINETESRMEKETQSLKQQIDSLNLSISREEDKAKMLEEKARIFTSGHSRSEDQEKLLEDLNQKVKEVYRRCLGDNDANLSTLHMLTNIENKLEQLFETIEMMPLDKVEQAEKMKDKERRQRLREEKMEAQRALQEERVQRALERARAPVKKKTGKAVVFRSAPPQKKKIMAEEEQKKEDEDSSWYWN